jgi:GR25 family glycosyltransferase involved in LPS biosynthesis
LYWDYFDKAYCISLVEREDRRQEAQRQFAKVGLSQKVEFMVVPKHPTDCEQGIYASHMMCMDRGLRAGAAHILIFEDDVVFDGFRSDRLGTCIDFLRTHPEWNMFFLGCMVKRSIHTENPAVVQVKFQCLCHAYAVNHGFAQRLVRIPWKGVPFDDTIRDLDADRLFSPYPAFAFQSDSPSDNERFLPLDRFRRLLGGLRRLQKLNGFYHRHKTGVVMVHLLLLALMVLVLWGVTS